MSIGDPVTPRCPKCNGKCVYNGNYFCTECSWGLPRLARERPGERWGYVPRALVPWVEEAYASLMKYRKERAR